jgi:adenylate cyclase class 2
MHNLEIKCRYADHRAARRHALRDGAIDSATLAQTDTYFNVASGRLKLRHNSLLAGGKSTREESHELIFYRRPNVYSPKASNYERLPLIDGPRALRFFTEGFGLRVCVRKTRRVFLKDNLRIHLDTVRGLGKFLEFELIVSPAHPLSACKKRMAQLLTLFQIPPESLIRYSYADLLTRNSPQRSRRK